MDRRRHRLAGLNNASRRLSFAAVVLGLAVPAALAAGHAGWVLAGSNPKDYWLEATGAATDDAGAQLQLHSASPMPGGFAAAGSRLDATNLAGKHVRITAELRTGGGKPAGYLWLRIDGEKPNLLLVNSGEFALAPGTEWQERTLTLPVLPEARSVVFGLVQAGEGSVEARNVRIQAFEPTSVSLQAAVLLEAAIDAVRKRAYYSARIDWPTIAPRLREWNRGASGSADVYPIIRELLTRLGDKHSSVMRPAFAKQMAAAGAGNAPVIAKKLGGGVVEVEVPGYLGTDVEALEHYAAAGRDKIAASASAASCGWIVDLRGNTGGNLWPMLGSLQALLGAEPWGYTVYADGKRLPWAISRALVDARADRKASAAATKPVAVLIGPRTASAGEAVAIAFRGRADTRSFGAPSRGLTTANASIPLPDGGLLVLTVALEMDRAGRSYDAALVPDESAEGDAALDAAKGWLRRVGSQCAGAPASGKLPSNGGQLGTGRSGPG